MIQLNNAQFLYDPRSPAGVSKINLEISKGRFIGLIGPSGSGKSTLLKVLTGEIRPQEGTLELPPLSDIVFSNQLTLGDENTNVQEYLVELYTKEETEEYEAINKARDLLSDFEITHIIQQNINQISRGEGQRLWMAGLLMNDPKLILLDEAFNGLDWQNRQNMLQTLKRISIEKKITLIWATQLLEETIRFCDELVLLNYGRIQQVGIPRDLIETPKNQFVAKFVGKKNLIVVQPKTNETLFGKIPLDQELDSEGLLVLEPFSCGEGDFKAKVIESYYDYGRYLNVLKVDERTFIGTSYKALKPNQMVSFSINLDSSYLLPEV